ncbi:MAG: hypothetical protein CMP11_00670 [Zetaproteobacteria bacterium]|nr:hypothetical protein [Pseudobdellovibrionaceae bacterium]
MFDIFFNKVMILEVLPLWMKEPLLGIEKFSLWQVTGFFFLILSGLIVKSIFNYTILRYIKKIFLKVWSSSYAEVLNEAVKPLGYLVFLVFVGTFLSGLGFNPFINKILSSALSSLSILYVVVFAYRSIDVFLTFLKEKASKTKSNLDDQLVPLIGRALKITTVILGVIFVLQNLNIDVTSLLAGVTIGGLAFSFAAKDTISNLFGSLTIFIDKPFTVGNWVKLPETEGIVESIGFRSTRIRTFYNSLVTVPNNRFTEVSVDNIGLRRYRRTRTSIGVVYNTSPDKIEAFCNGIRVILKAHPKTRKDYYEVHFTGFGDFSLNILVYFFLETSSWSDELRSRHEVYLDILRLAQKLSVEMAFPTQTLHFHDASKSPVEKERDLGVGELEKSVAEFQSHGKEYIAPGPRLGEAYYSQK